MSLLFEVRSPLTELAEILLGVAGKLRSSSGRCPAGSRTSNVLDALFVSLALALAERSGATSLLDTVSTEVNAILERAKEIGGSVVLEPEDGPERRIGYMADPDGFSARSRGRRSGTNSPTEPRTTVASRT